MNAGAYGGETKDVLVEARAVDRSGTIHVLSNADMKYTYRHCGAPEDLIFTRRCCRAARATRPTSPPRWTRSPRAARRPSRSRAAPAVRPSRIRRADKSWQLIDRPACAALPSGQRKVSELHCNFLINEGGATRQPDRGTGRDRARQGQGHLRHRSRVGDQAHRPQGGRHAMNAKRRIPSETTVAVLMGGWSAERRGQPVVGRGLCRRAAPCRLQCGPHRREARAHRVHPAGLAA